MGIYFFVAALLAFLEVLFRAKAFFAVVPLAAFFVVVLRLVAELERRGAVAFAC